MKFSPPPYIGFGLGLRTCYFEEILTTEPNVDWFEVISENYFVSGGKPWYYLSQIKERYPIVMHGVSMSIGSTTDVNFDYLSKLKQTIERIQPLWISDHLCFSSLGDFNSHDLLPMPYTEESLEHLCKRLSVVQDFLERPLILENVSSYLTYQASEMSEWEFLAELHSRTGCQFLLDINNIYVSARNHQFDPNEFLNAIPASSIAQIHLAGHSDFGTHIIDTHDQPICNEVWQLFANFAKTHAPVNTMIERDDNFPAFAEIISELEQARTLASRAWSLHEHA
ncbi:MNIO family bufferin maturase [Pseudoalteromonas luteoviolacea]|uniref:Uncharacterized protein n=1 Tax=Pseudoalteromonas luteoviolacea S4054 TaxID=1129367 RepID=A0A0F6AHV4_9GAMM|nr:DUF692 domain-containing protein [Pseudoalteromonas luteoviolacea]AOT11059.1 hypothetical protein S4054249_24810 [Pseudoalteromonas luteoviolacea]AOT15777.1 hypothetical protein S40542_23700 [Pseudoalteromonas luteoviolacea]AOT20880.1 hypothetical protein S4054_24730 [Pseudoalteromonas luteoviolacea]KKE85743.1 hypothetical protein N479_24625 [Pseudoalteromonas luteoviolacea S4054]KZN71102.1 hypothetical protein N481_19680 [Pseudoalteromonas luteoviolacea S4047-1]